MGGGVGARQWVSDGAPDELARLPTQKATSVGAEGGASSIERESQNKAAGCLILTLNVAVGPCSLGAANGAGWLGCLW